MEAFGASQSGFANFYERFHPVESAGGLLGEHVRVATQNSVTPLPLSWWMVEGVVVVLSWSQGRDSTRLASYRLMLLNIFER